MQSCVCKEITWSQRAVRQPFRYEIVLRMILDGATTSNINFFCISFCIFCWIGHELEEYTVNGSYCIWVVLDGLPKYSNGIWIELPNYDLWELNLNCIDSKMPVLGIPNKHNLIVLVGGLQHNYERVPRATKRQIMSGILTLGGNIWKNNSLSMKLYIVHILPICIIKEWCFEKSLKFLKYYWSS